MRRTVRLAASVVALALPSTGCSSDDNKPKLHQVSNQSVGADVSVTGNVPEKLTVKATDRVTARLQGVKPLASALKFSPAADVSPSAAVSIGLKEAMATGKTVLVAVADNDKGPWKLVQADLSADRKTVQVQTSHLYARWQLLEPDVPAIRELFVRELAAAMQGDLKTDAPAPKCENEAQAKAGLDMAMLPQDSLLWCAGMTSGKHVVKIVNPMRYPLRVSAVVRDADSTSGNSATSVPTKARHFKQLERTTGNMLLPYEERTFLVQVKPKQIMSLSAEFDREAYGLGTFQATVTALMNVVSDLVAGGPKYSGKLSAASYVEIANVMDQLLKNDMCSARATGEGTQREFDVRKYDFTGMVRECFSGAYVKPAFGWQKDLVLPIMKEDQTNAYYSEAFHALGDKVNAAEHARLWVVPSAGQPSLDPATLTGRWTYDCNDNNRHIVTIIDANGKVEWSENDGEKTASMHFFKAGGKLMAVVDKSFYQGQEILRLSQAADVDWMPPLMTLEVFQDRWYGLVFNGNSLSGQQGGGLYAENEVQTQC
ncbi:hypothetical protein [Micromonospora sp. NPDC005305]|uniref:hypothetical protein n=1 Tax=Micromonospora sp. NPDC005305 TaxID=3156875 RepID=UPI0033A1BFC0